MTDGSKPTWRLRIVRLFVSSALSSLLALNWWRPVVSLENFLPAVVVGHYLILSIFAHFLSIRPLWSVLIASIRDMLLVGVQVCVMIHYELWWMLFSQHGDAINRGENLRLFIVSAGYVLPVLSLIFLLVFTVHTVINRIQTRNRWLSFTTTQLFLIFILLTAAMFFCTAAYENPPSAVMETYGWPFVAIVIEKGAAPKTDTRALLADIICIVGPCVAYLVLCGGTPTSTDRETRKQRLIGVGIVLMLIATFSVGVGIYSKFEENYGWPFPFYLDRRYFLSASIHLNCYCYLLFALIIFSVRSNPALVSIDTKV